MTRMLVAAAIAAAAAALVSGCTQVGDFPKVLDRPDARSETPMSPEQLKLATDALISQRQQLAAEACTTQSNPLPPLAKPLPGTPPPPAATLCPPAAPAVPAATTTQTAGARTKP
jgi:hypothetical protein